MADGPWYTIEHVLRAEVEKHGSVTAAAVANGTPRPTVQHWIKRFGVRSGHKNTPGGGDAPSTPDAAVETIVREVDPVEVSQMRRALERKDAELRSLRVEVKQNARNENLLDDIRELMQPAITGLVLPTPAALPVRKRTRRKPLTMVWHATDIHWGEIVDAATVNGMNAYSPEIAAKRLEHTVDTILQLADNYEAAHGVEELVIVQNGDGIGGSIHPDSAEYYARAGKQTVDLAMVLSQIIHEAASRFRKVRYIGTVGNHPRTTHRMPTGSARMQTSWESLVHEMTAALTSRIRNVEYVIAQGYTVDAYIGPSRWAFSHGDALSGGGGQLGIPAYGLKKQHDANREWSVVLAQLSEQAMGNSIVKHTRCGHFHTYFAWQAGAADIALCPSQKGVDPFVKDKLAKYSPPQALVEVVHPEHDVIGHHIVDLTGIGDGKSRYVWGAMDSDQPAAKLMPKAAA